MTSLPAPALFVSHGAPTVALEEGRYAHDLQRWAESIPPPRAIIVVSAHWLHRGSDPAILVNPAAQHEIIYDFGGFPDALYRLSYPVAGDPALADRVIRLLTERGIRAAGQERGLDHGVWIPLRILFPAAAIPVVEVSVPAHRGAELLLEAGRVLAPLRREGALLMGSGGMVHNLSQVRFNATEDESEGWVEDFEQWVWNRIERRETDTLLTAWANAPSASLAVPTSEHFDPLFFVLGSMFPEDRIVPIHRGTTMGTLSMRTFALQSPSI